MVFNTWADVLSQSFQNLFYGVVAFIPNLVVAIIIFIVGWLVGVGLGRVVAPILGPHPVGPARQAAGLGLSSGKFLGLLVEWFFIIVFLIASLQVLGLTQVNLFLSQVGLGYLPQVIGAVLILLVAAVVAEAAERVVSGSARAAEMHSAGFLGKVARYAIWVFAILAALTQLNVAAGLIQALVQGIIIAVALAVGLAFGLGGQASAARYIEHLQSEIKD